MPYEEPAQPTETAPKKLASTLTARASAAQAIVPMLAFFVARHLECDLETAAMLAGGLFALLQAIAQVAMRRAIGGWLLVACLLLPACTSPDLRPTLTATRATLGALRGDYARGRLVIAGARPETLEELRAARLAEIDATDAALKAAEEASK